MTDESIPSQHNWLRYFEVCKYCFWMMNLIDWEWSAISEKANDHSWHWLSRLNCWGKMNGELPNSSSISNLSFGIVNHNCSQSQFFDQSKFRLW
jgi:hypothetical protein